MLVGIGLRHKLDLYKTKTLLGFFTLSCRGDVFLIICVFRRLQLDPSLDAVPFSLDAER